MTDAMNESQRRCEAVIEVPQLDNRDKLKKNITVTRGIAIMVGAISGSAIFVTPSTVASTLNAPASSILMWLVGGIVAMCGGLVFCELGTMFPVSGGEVVYLKRIYGPLGGFLSVWMLHFLLSGMKQAINILTFSKYFWAIFYEDPEMEVNWWLHKALPIVLFLAIVALSSTKPELMLKSIVFFTALQVVSMIIIIMAGFINGTKDNISIGFKGTNFDAKDWGIAWNGVIYAYMYWEIICSITSEIQNPKKNLPIIVVISIAIISGLYLLTVISFHIVMPLSSMAEDKPVAVEFGFQTMGEPGKIVIGAVIALSTLGGSQSLFVSLSRYIHSGSVEGLLPSCFGLVSKKFKTPVVSILFLAVGTTAFVLIGGIDDLINWATFMIFPFHVACAVGVFILRKTCPEIPRPCKISFIFPALFTIFGIYFFINAFIGEDWPASLICISLLMLGVPLYFVTIKNVFQLRFLRKLDMKVTAFFAGVLNCD